MMIRPENSEKVQYLRYDD